MRCRTNARLYCTVGSMAKRNFGDRNVLVLFKDVTSVFLPHSKTVVQCSARILTEKILQYTRLEPPPLENELSTVKTLVAGIVQGTASC